MNHKIHHRADFLNKQFHHSDASIFSSISVDTKDKEQKYTNFNCEFKVRDCDETVSMNFYIDNEEDFENCLYKIDTMINHLKEFKRAMERGGKLYLKDNEKKL